MISQQVISGVLLLKYAKAIVSRFSDISEGWRQCFDEYIRYCKPLIPSLFLAFVYTYSDRWLLQTFSGPIEQGYFQISTQLSLITMVFTTSLLKVFAKESASALGEQDKEKLGRIYRYTYVSTILVISFITGMITPWTREILLATVS